MNPALPQHMFFLLKHGDPSRRTNALQRQRFGSAAPLRPKGNAVASTQQGETVPEADPDAGRRQGDARHQRAARWLVRTASHAAAFASRTKLAE